MEHAPSERHQEHCERQYENRFHSPERTKRSNSTAMCSNHVPCLRQEQWAWGDLLSRVWLTHRLGMSGLWAA